MSIQNLSSDVAMHHMLTALRSRLYVDSLYLQLTASLDKLKERVSKYTLLEELREFCN